MTTTDTNIYRSVAKKLAESSSSEEGELSSDDSCDDQSTMKRSKMTSEPNHMITNDVIVAPPTVQSQLSTSPREVLVPKRKKNFKNIWSNVITEQSSNDIASSLGNVGMKNFMSRGPESFSLHLAEGALRGQQRHSFSQSDESDGGEDASNGKNFQNEMENYMIDRHHKESTVISKDQNHQQHNSNKRAQKRKFQNNRRQGNNKNVPNHMPGKRVVLNTKREITPEDTLDVVAEEIAYRLWERKRHLLRDVISCIGNEKAIFIYKKAEAIELNGGLIIHNGLRRRTPGGTFLHLVRNEEDLDQEALKKIFDEEHAKETAKWEAKRQARKNKQKDRTDSVGETPQNSPTQKEASEQLPVASDQTPLPEVVEMEEDSAVTPPPVDDVINDADSFG